MVEKLCQRFANTDDERIWRDIAYCLSLLPFKSERSFRRLLEGLPAYQDKLHEKSVYKSFQEIIAKVTCRDAKRFEDEELTRSVSQGRLQKAGKPELKAIIDEFEQKIQKLSGESTEDTEEGAGEEEAVPASNMGNNSNSGNTSTRSASRKKRGEYNTQNHKIMTFANVIDIGATRETRPQRRATQKRKRVIVEESEDEESEDDVSMSEGED